MEFTYIDNCSAVKLFVTWAKSVSPQFALNQDNLAEIVLICGMVGGLPLAIELAACWTRVLSHPEIARQIEKDIDFCYVVA